uniref:Glycosyltransferase RgtA/B/C/D-like domain-containing protein n=1 Tax=Eiseniibacteriota bacterium TaxID=2212470 RepID=A0A832MM14_UNCEI
MTSLPPRDGRGAAAPETAVPAARGPAGRAPRRGGAAPRAALLGVLAVAALLRLREAAATPLWFDEIFSLRAARLPFTDMLALLAGDVHPPLPTVLLWLWRRAVGDSAALLKLLPVAIGAATVAVTYAMAADLFGRRAGLLAAALLAVHRTHVYFSQELRSYALLALAVTLAAWGAWRWTRRMRGGGALWVAGAALALHTHYLGGLVAAFAAAWAAWAVRGEPRRWRAWALLQLATAALFAPQLPVFAEHLARLAEHWMRAPGVEHLWSLARQASFGAAYAVPPLAALAALPLARRATRPAAAHLAWMMLAPVLLAWGLSTLGARLFIERTMYFVLPWWCALLGAGLAGLRPPALAAIAAAATLAFGARALALKPPHPEAVALRRAAEAIAARGAPGDLVVCADTHSLFTVEEHLGARVRAVLLMQWERLPYYEGAAFVRAEQRVTADSLAAWAAAGRRWWGLRTPHGGVPGDSAARLMDRLARGGRLPVAHVTLWAGRADMAVAPEEPSPHGARRPPRRP